MMKEWLRKYGKSLLLIAGTVLVERGVNWLIDAAPQVGYSIFSTFTNIIYVSAARHTDSLFVTILLNCVIGCTLGLAYFMMKNDLPGYRLATELKKEMKNMTMEERKEFFDSRKKNEEDDPSEQDEFEEIDKVLDERRKTGKKAIFNLCLTVIMCVFLFTTLFYPSDLRHDFERDIISIHPYVEEQTVLKLKSDWVQMRGKSDYIEIYKIIDAVKNEYHLK